MLPVPLQEYIRFLRVRIPTLSDIEIAASLKTQGWSEEVVQEAIGAYRGKLAVPAASPVSAPPARVMPTFPSVPPMQPVQAPRPITPAPPTIAKPMQVMPATRPASRDLFAAPMPLSSGSLSAMGAVPPESAESILASAPPVKQSIPASALEAPVLASPFAPASPITAAAPPISASVSPVRPAMSTPIPASSVMPAFSLPSMRIPATAAASMQQPSVPDVGLAHHERTDPIRDAPTKMTSPFTKESSPTLEPAVIIHEDVVPNHNPRPVQKVQSQVETPIQKEITNIMHPPAFSGRQEAQLPAAWLALVYLIPLAVVICGALYYGISTSMPHVFRIGNEFLADIQRSLILGIEPSQGMSTVLVLTIPCGISLLFIVLSNFAVRRAYRKSASPLSSFLYGNAVHFLLVVVLFALLQFSLPYIAKNVPDDVSFAVSLVLSMAVAVSIFFLFIGFVIGEIFLLLTYVRPRELRRTRWSVQWQIAVFIVALLASTYAFSVWYMPAVMTKQKALCYLIFQPRLRADCFVKITTGASSVVANNAVAESTEPTFSLTPMDEFKQIGGLTDVGGKLAYLGTRADNTGAIVYDGVVVSEKYTHFGALPIASIGGKLAYDVLENFSREATTSAKSFIVYEGQELGKQYDTALQPRDVGGKLAYLARRGEKQFIVWDGKEYGAEYDTAGNIADVGGKLAYATRKGTGQAKTETVFLDGKRVGGEYSWVRWLHGKEGHLIFLAQKKDGKDALVYDGTEYGAGYERLDGLYALIGDKFAFQAVKNKKQLIVYDDKEYGAEYKEVSPPYEVDGALMYYVRSEDGSGQIFRDATPVTDIIPKMQKIAISEGGQIAYAVGEEKGELTVYLNESEVFKGGVTNFWFEGEKLAFFAEDNRVGFLWYDGHRVGEGMYGFNYLVTVAGKLAGAPFASTPESAVKYYLLEEK